MLQETNVFCTSRQAATPEVEEILRDTLLSLVKEDCGQDVLSIAQTQVKRPVVDVHESISKKDLSKYKLAKAFLRWIREHELNDLSSNEITQAETLIEKVNKARQENETAPIDQKRSMGAAIYI